MDEIKYLLRVLQTGSNPLVVTIPKHGSKDSVYCLSESFLNLPY